MLESSSLLKKRNEFNMYLWDHAADEFQMQFDVRRALSEQELDFLRRVQLAIINPDDDSALEMLRLAVTETSSMTSLLLQICGLTRNKILTDLRANAEVRKSNISIPSSFNRISVPLIWPVSGPYLLKRLRSVLSHVDPQEVSLAAIFEALNQATWPGYIRQERAKRSGHEAEYRMATLLFSLHIPFVPVEKAENPLCRDAQIDGISFDLVIPSIKKPRLLVKSTMHTSNIGQYGESKDDLEIRQARSWMKQLRKPKPTLLAFIDGVGFRSNKAGLNGVLTHSDEFCQFKTIWKAALIAARLTKMSIEVALYETERAEFRDFISRWNAKDMIVIREDISSFVGWQNAGVALTRPKAR